MKSEPPRGKTEPTGPFNWPSGYQKMAPCTMNTLFWAGSVFAPQLCLLRDTEGRILDEKDAINIQHFLQNAYVEAYGQLVDALASCPALIGIELMNEPHRGYVNLYSFNRWNYLTDLHIGHYPSALQGLALGDGHSQMIPFYVKTWPVPSRLSHYTRVDPQGLSAWYKSSDSQSFPNTRKQDGCLWREHGVWDWDEKKQKPIVLQADYFHVDPRPGQQRRPVEWYRDFYAPFVQKFDQRVRRSSPSLFLLVEPIPNEFMPRWGHGKEPHPCTTQTILPQPRPSNFVYAPHFYDLNVLFFKSYRGMSVNVQGLGRGMFLLCALYFGTWGLFRNYLHQITTLCRRGRDTLGQVPILLGEVGIPYDVNESLIRNPGDYSVQATLLDALISAMEKNWVSFTLWNYNPSNTVAHGDEWNMEDFSIINLELPAKDKQNTHYDKIEYQGGRALDAIIRPYACKVAGIPQRTSWNRRTRTFTFMWRAMDTTSEDPKSAITEIFVPEYLTHGSVPEIVVKHGEYEFHALNQTLYVKTTDEPGAMYSVTIRFGVRTRVQPVIGIGLAVLVLLFALLSHLYMKRMT